MDVADTKLSTGERVQPLSLCLYLRVMKRVEACCMTEAVMTCLLCAN